MVEKIKEGFKICVISLTTVLVIFIVLVLIAALHTYKFFRNMMRGELFFRG